MLLNPAQNVDVFFVFINHFFGQGKMFDQLQFCEKISFHIIVSESVLNHIHIFFNFFVEEKQAMGRFAYLFMIC